MDAHLGKASLQRTTFETSRLLDFFSEKELVAQTGHEVAEWPLVIVKELIDNALDACEEAGIAPVISVTVDEAGIEVTDNGPGMPRKPSRACWIIPSGYPAARLTSGRHAAHKATR